MDKADKRALEALPKRKDGRTRLYYCNDDDVRKVYARGYRRAKKDLALTWEDVKKICSLSFVVEVALGRKVSDETHYAEVLRRFNEYKQKTK